MAIDVIVIHISEGSMSSMVSWFNDPASKVSSHFAVGRDGGVIRFLPDEAVAWHAGKVTKPTAEIVKEREGKSPNTYSLGIECEGKATEEPTRMQMGALADLVRQLAAEHSIPLTRRHIIGHREIRADKTCPGLIDVDKVVAMALELAKAPEPEPETSDTDGGAVAALNNLESHLLAGLAEVQRIRAGLA